MEVKGGTMTTEKKQGWVSKEYMQLLHLQKEAGEEATVCGQKSPTATQA